MTTTEKLITLPLAHECRENLEKDEYQKHTIKGINVILTYFFLQSLVTNLLLPPSLPLFVRFRHSIPIYFSTL